MRITRPIWLPGNGHFVVGHPFVLTIEIKFHVIYSYNHSILSLMEVLWKGLKIIIKLSFCPSVGLVTTTVVENHLISKAKNQYYLIMLFVMRGRSSSLFNCRRRLRCSQPPAVFTSPKLYYLCVGLR